MDAELWTQSISETDAPAYPCPHCGKAVLLMQPETFVAHATVACLSQQPDEGWDPLIAHYGFFVLAEVRIIKVRWLCCRCRRRSGGAGVGRTVSANDLGAILQTSVRMADAVDFSNSDRVPKTRRR